MPGPAIPDYHVHSTFSDGHDGLAVCVERALELGLAELGFSEHLAPLCLGADANYYSIDHARLEEYVEAVRDTAARYPETRLLCGLEVDYAPEAVDDLADLLARCSFDYALCSVHFTGGFAFNAAENREAAGWQDPDRVFRGYWMGLREAAEINTSGLDRHPVGEMYPAVSVLERAHAAGIRLTFGSDAHRAADICACFARAVEWARAAGYQDWLRLSDRQAVALPLP